MLLQGFARFLDVETQPVQLFLHVHFGQYLRQRLPGNSGIGLKLQRMQALLHDGGGFFLQLRQPGDHAVQHRAHAVQPRGKHPGNRFAFARAHGDEIGECGVKEAQYGGIQRVFAVVFTHQHAG